MTKKTTRTRAESKKLMWEYYRENKNKLPGSIRESREEILAMIRFGTDVGIVFQEFVNL